MGKSCCHCCSFDSLGCRLRTLKAMGALLFLFGIIFALAGIAIGFLSDLYFELISLPDVFPEYILFAYLVISTGIVALGTGMAAIYIARTMSDDDCSTRGLGILALLTIVCSLATVGVPAWPLYENGYFLEIPPQTSALNTTTPFAATTTPLPATTVPDIMSTVNMSVENSNTTAMNETSMTTNGTVAQINGTVNETTPMNATSMDNNATVSSNSTSNETMSVGSTNMTMSNVTADNSTESISTPDSNNTVTSALPMTTPDVTGGTTMSYTTGNFTGNSTESTITRVPIDYDEWLVIMAPFGIICVFAFIFVLFGLFIFCIACCCPERSEIVDDIDLYKS